MIDVGDFSTLEAILQQNMMIEIWEQLLRIYRKLEDK